MNSFRAFLLGLVGFIVSYSADVKADHITGGSIAWECISSGSDAGKFRFFLTIYRNCASVQNVTAFIRCENDSTVGNISMSLISSTDLSPTNCGLDCASAAPTDVGLIEELVYQSNPIAINSTPPPGGLIFSYNACCRPVVQNLFQPQFTTSYFRAVMYPYNGQDLNPCYDSSPGFVAESNSLMCSGYQLHYACSAVDPDLDSVSYSWSPAMKWDDVSGTSLPADYMPNYSPSNPLPSPPMFPGFDTPTIDLNSGLIEYNTDPGLVGAWSMTVSAYAWRNNILVSETTRELIVQTTSCSTNNQVPQPNGAANTNIVVNAGDLVTFNIGALDPDMPNGVAQNVTMTANGNMFSGDFTDPNNCSSPPCATLNPAPPVTGAGGVTTQFNWQTDCSHLTAFNLSSYTYDFVFRFEDDNCPVPGISFANVSVTVVGDEIMPSPEARCVSVIDDDNIQIDWETIAPINPMPASFAYVVYHSTSPNGPWTEIGTVTDVNIGSFIHSTGMATNPLSTGANYYQIRNRSGCITAPAETPALYTVSSIFLDLTNNGETLGINWNHVVDPPLATAGGGNAQYDIYERNPAGTGSWNQVASTTNLTFTRAVTECQEQVDFRVDLSDNLPCTSSSNIASDLLFNANAPAPQPLDSVTVVNDPVFGEVAMLGWPQSTSANVTLYTIDQQDLSQLPLPVYNPGPETPDLFYIDQNSQPASEKVCYRIRAISSCDVPGYQDPLDQRQCTMLLEVELDACEKTNILSWTPFEQWAENVKEYEILVSKDGGQELKVATVHRDSTRFAHQSLQLSATYCYRVRAVRNLPDRRVTSTSNQQCQQVFISKIPEYHYGYETTVPHNEKVLHQFFLDSTAGISKIEVHRGQDTDTTGFVGEVDFDPLTRFYEFSDFRARPNLRPYYYRTIVYDECEHPMDTSDFTRTIYLEVEANTDRTNVLTWNEYVGWPTGIEHFDIYRDYVGSGDFEYLTTLPVTTLTYTDNVVELLEGEGNFCYYIEAAENGPWYVGDPPYSFDQRSRSNIGCAPQHPNIFIPNAFAPNGVNKLFLPVSIYVDYQSYVFTVYDRFGGHIMRTLDKNLGWDGTLSNGMDAAQGVYGYTVEYETAEGVSGVKTGTITLYR